MVNKISCSVCLIKPQLNNWLSYTFIFKTGIISYKNENIIGFKAQSSAELTVEWWVKIRLTVGLK